MLVQTLSITYQQLTSICTKTAEICSSVFVFTFPCQQVNVMLHVQLSISKFLVTSIEHYSAQFSTPQV